jgi:hypothetical protein
MRTITFVNPLRSLLIAWYRIAAPPEPPPTAPLWQREVARRARIISLVMLIAIWLVVFTFLVQPSRALAISLAVVTVIDLVAVVVFNRRGKTTICGLIITATTELGILFNIISLIHMQGAITVGIVLTFPLLVEGVVVAASTTRPLIASGVFIVNSLFITSAAFFVPHAPDVVSLLQGDVGLGKVFEIPLSVLQIAFFVIVIWVTSANQAIIRADAASLRADYAEKMAKRDHEVLMQKQQIERDVYEIITVLAQISQHPEQEIMISSNNQLNALQVALRTLRSRQQKNNFELAVYQRSQRAAQELAAFMKADIPLSQWQSTGTMIDELVLSFNRYRPRQRNGQP